MTTESKGDDPEEENDRICEIDSDLDRKIEANKPRLKLQDQAFGIAVKNQNFGVAECMLRGLSLQEAVTNRVQVPLEGLMSTKRRNSQIFDHQGLELEPT